MNGTVQVRTRDGVLLSTSVETPDGPGPWPVVVARTPYVKAGMASRLSGFVQRGYAVVVQDVRGTGESQGAFTFLKGEVPDAEDTGRWILDQPFCNGNIGLVGISYLGGSSLGMAQAFPGNVKAATWVSPVLGGLSLFLVNGAIRLHHNLPWTALANPKFRETDWRSLYKHLPLKDALLTAGIESSLWDTLCSYLTGMSAPQDLSATFRSLSVPGLHFAGFWDFMLDTGLFGYDALVKAGSKQQSLVLGPWSHNGIAGEVTRNEYADYGADGSSGFQQRMLSWFDYWLKGRDQGGRMEGRVSTYVPDRGWIETPAWPPAEATSLTLYLGAGGSLRPEPGARGALGYVYDPRDPVPTEGGALWEFPRAGLNPGPAPVTTGNRQDVLVFQGQELTAPVVAFGPAEVHLYVDTDAPSTDFTVKLVDVGIDGVPRIVADSIYRLKAPQPGQITVELPGVGHVFGKEHRIRLDVSSSNFPKFDRNLNTGVSSLISSEMRKAKQVVEFGEATPSQLRLTIL